MPQNDVRRPGEIGEDRGITHFQPMQPRWLIYLQAIGLLSMVNEIQTALFIDLDETILSNPFETAVFPLVSAKISDKAGLPVESITRMLLFENERRMSDGTLDPPLVFDWDDIVKTVAKGLGIEIDISIEHLVREYSRPPYISILDKSDSVLKKIRKPHRLIVAVTNGLSKYQLPVLHALGIAQLFDDFLAPDVNNVLKGHKGFYGDVLPKMKVAISIGDTYEHDIVRPKSLGMHAVWLNRSMDSELRGFSPFDRVSNCVLIAHKEVRPDAIIMNLAELPPVVGKIEEQYLD